MTLKQTKQSERPFHSISLHYIVVDLARYVMFSNSDVGLLSLLLSARVGALSLRW